MKLSIVASIVAALPGIVMAAPAVPGTSINRRITKAEKVLLYPGGFGPLIAGFNQLPYASFTDMDFTHASNNKIPNFCKEESRQLKANGSPRCTMSEMQVYGFSFSDSPGRFWNICRCNDSPVSWAVSRNIS